MGIIFSRQCEYAIQAVLYIAKKPAGKCVPIREITEQLDLPYHFAAKILQTLTNKGLLNSQKGASGGFSLVHPAHNLTPYHIIEAIDGAGFMESCVLGFPECDGVNTCSMHDTWGKIREELHKTLSAKNVIEMSSVMHKVVYRKH